MGSYLISEIDRILRVFVMLLILSEKEAHKGVCVLKSFSKSKKNARHKIINPPDLRPDNSLQFSKNNLQP